MAIRKSLNVSLTPELDRFVQERVSTGRYQTASEVVREGLRLLEQHEQENDLVPHEIRAKIVRGAAQADRGELFPPSKLIEEIAELKRKRAAKKR
jgi:antitoxin ParD1/3/4